MRASTSDLSGGLTRCRGRSLGGGGWTEPAGDEAALLGGGASRGLEMFGRLRRRLRLDGGGGTRGAHGYRRRERGGGGHGRRLRERLEGKRGLRGAGAGAARGGAAGRDDGGLGARVGTLAVSGAGALAARLQVLQETAGITTGP